MLDIDAINLILIYWFKLVVTVQNAWLRTKWYGQHAMDKMVAISCKDFYSTEFSFY